MRKKKNCGVKNSNSISILKIHEDKMLSFSKNSKEKVIKELQNTLKKHNDEIELFKKEHAINNINNNRDKIDIINTKVCKLNEDIINIEKKISLLKTNKEEMEYVINTCNILNNYIQLEEQENNLLEGIDNENENEGNVNENLLNDISKQKQDLIDDYMKIVDSTYVTTRNMMDYKQSYCKYCPNTLLVIENGGGCCHDCGWYNPRIIHESETLSWQQTQEMDYRPQFTYQRESHLDEWLRRFQAKEHREIPKEIITQVILESQKERIKDLNTLTELQVKKYLKKLNLKDYYDNVISIINKINNRPAFKLTAEIEGKIKEMFHKIQDPFEKHKPDTRKSMLSYSYLLNKFFLILDLPEFSRYFFLLKSPEKLRQQDEIFKKIVDELAVKDPSIKWTFHPSC